MTKPSTSPPVAGLVLAAVLLLLVVAHLVLFEEAAMWSRGLLLAIAGLGWLGAALIIWSWCAAAAEADRRTEHTRQVDATRARLARLCAPPEDTHPDAWTHTH